MAGEMRTTWYFGQAQTGWSETWWYPQGKGTLYYQEVEALTEARVAMLGASHNLLAVRMTEEGAGRFTRLLLAGKKTTVDNGLLNFILPSRGKEDGTGGDVEGAADQVRAALQVEVVKGGQRLGLRYLAGIPDDISLTEPQTMNTDFLKKWWRQFAIWRTELITSGWAIKSLDKGVGFPLIPVVTYRLRTAAPSVLGVVMSSTATWTHVQGQKVALQGVRMTRRGLKSPNGTWVIDGVEVDEGLAQRTVWLRGTEGFEPDTFLTLGKVRGVAYSYQLPTWLEPHRVGIHKRGKPFGSPVGRRPNR